MEKNGKCRYYLPEKWRFLKGLTRLLMLICLVNMPVHVFSQEKRFSFEFTNVPVSTVFLSIEKIVIILSCIIRKNYRRLD